MSQVHPFQARKTYVCPGASRRSRPASATWWWSLAAVRTCAGTGTDPAGTAGTAGAQAAERGDLGYSGRRPEGGVEVRPQVLDVLDADGHAHQPRRQTALALPPAPPFDQGLDPAEAGPGVASRAAATAASAAEAPPATSNDTMVPKPRI